MDLHVTGEKPVQNEIDDYISRLGRFDTGERAFPSPSALCFSAPAGRAECFQDALISLTQCIADAIIRQKEQESSIFLNAALL